MRRIQNVPVLSTLKSSKTLAFSVSASMLTRVYHIADLNLRQCVHPIIFSAPVCHDLLCLFCIQDYYRRGIGDQSIRNKLCRY